jgi:hypothetical protein
MIQEALDEYRDIIHYNVYWEGYKYFSIQPDWDKASKENPYQEEALAELWEKGYWAAHEKRW